MNYNNIHIIRDYNKYLLNTITDIEAKKDVEKAFYKYINALIEIKHGSIEELYMTLCSVNGLEAERQVVVWKETRHVHEKIKKLFMIEAMDIIIRNVTYYFRVSKEDIKEKRRFKEILIPRKIAMFYGYSCGLTLKFIGQQLGGFDHATSLHAYNSILSDITAINGNIIPNLGMFEYIKDLCDMLQLDMYRLLIKKI